MRDLVARTARYVAIPSVSGDERALADEIERTLRAATHLTVTRVGDNVVARTSGGRRTRVLVAGHIDTVPGDPAAVRVVDGVVTGLGACDMKGSIAVMVELACEPSPWACEATWVFYANEEVARDRSGLLELERADAGLLAADVALLGEPTSCVVEAGCQGTVKVECTFLGERAHTARPWRGRNAIHRLAAPLAAIQAYDPRVAVLDGVTYTEQLQVVAVHGGVAANVVPDAASITINHRVAPDRSTSDAVRFLHDLLDPYLEPSDTFTVVDCAEPAAPNLADPVIRRLVELSGAAPRAKLGYTDVSHFALKGVPAVNFGAGDPELAHHAGEFVDRGDLDRCHEVLAALLRGADGA